MSKIFWFDTETTGVDPKKNAMIQLAGLMEIDGHVVEEVNMLFSPILGRVVTQEALDTNGKTIEEIEKYPHPQLSLIALKKVFGQYVNKFDRDDKLIPAGFRTDFDCDFLRSTFMGTGDKFYGSWFFNCVIDVRTLVALAIQHLGVRLVNYKLGTCCEFFEIPLGDEAHDALADIRATRALYFKIFNLLREIN